MSLLHAHFLNLAGGQIKRKSWNIDGADDELGDGTVNFVSVLSPTEGKRLALFSIQYIIRTNTSISGSFNGGVHMQFGPATTALTHIGLWTATTATNGGSIEGVVLGPHYFKWGVPKIGDIDEDLYMRSFGVESVQLEPVVIIDYVEF